MNFFKVSMLPVLSILLLSFIACSSDDDASPSGSNFGDFQLDVSGDFNAQKSGFADFDGMQSNHTHIWSIDMHDGTANSQTLSLSFSLFSATGEVNQPSPGTYEIGFEANSSDVFTAIYAHIPDGNFLETVEYSTLPTGDQFYGGTLVIETSNADVVSGSFEFTAARVDDDFNVVGEITVSGEFNARKRMN